MTNYYKKVNSIIIPHESFNAARTLNLSAQAFQWLKHEDGYMGHSQGKAAIIKNIPDGIEIVGVDDDDVPFWINYLDLERNYDAWIGSWMNDKIISSAYHAMQGMHILRQPVWEALIAFITSANNNVERIRGLVNSLCASYGDEITLNNGLSVKGFPSPKALYDAGHESMRKLGFGYRSEYLIATAKLVLDGFNLDSAREMDYDSAAMHLQHLMGVGPKVADCVLLFGCGQGSAFPVDVWVERVMMKYYKDTLNLPNNASRKLIKLRAQQEFGDAAGIIQQYLFCWMREGYIEDAEED